MRRRKSNASAHSLSHNISTKLCCIQQISTTKGKQMKVIYVSTLLLMTVLTGCASILNDKTQAINVSSSTGSDIQGTVNGMPFKAPGVANVVRENKNKIFITETEGCVKETVAEKSVDTKFFINILSGGPFGSSTDYSTDKMWKYNDSVIIACKK